MNALRSTLASVVLVGSLLTGAASTSAADRAQVDPRLPASDVLVLTGDVDERARQLATFVVEAARRHDIPVTRREVEIRSVERVRPGTLLGGQTDGRLILVGRNVALPDRTLVHELAHAVVGLGHDHHGQRWRRVYLSAMADAFDERMAARERRRLAWVYDRSYLDRVDVDDREGHAS
jgi:hypothetical protein